MTEQQLSREPIEASDRTYVISETLADVVEDLIGPMQSEEPTVSRSVHRKLVFVAALQRGLRDLQNTGVSR